MEITKLHEWNLSPREAVELQKQLAFEVVRQDDFAAPVKTVAGIDLGFDAANDTCRAVVAVLSFPELELLESAMAILPIQFPYVPGLLSFRETPVAVKALEQLTVAPDLILCDGQGIAHPRRFGIACHIGLITRIPSIGVAKSLLVGKYGSLGTTRGSVAPLIHRNEQVASRSEQKTTCSRFTFRSDTKSVWKPPPHTFCSVRRNTACRKRRGWRTKWLRIGKFDKNRRI
jgi:deoxyribonuclease V